MKTWISKNEYTKEGGGHMILNEIIMQLQKLAPEAMAQDWDNVGLLVGDRRQDITRVFLALDADEAAIAQAKETGAELLLTHHPLIFSPLKKINSDHFISARIVELLRSQMSYYAMHTNFDAAKMGELAAARIGLSVEAPLADVFEYDGKTFGIGVVGTLPETESLGGLCAVVKHGFGLDHVRVFRARNERISRVAICPGSGKSTIRDALAAGAQVLITGDIDHHSGIDAVAQGLSIVDAGHYGIEHIFISYMERYLKEHVQGVEVCAQARRDPFIVV